MTNALEDAAADPGIADAFRQPGAARMSVRALDRASLTVTEIRLDRNGFGETGVIPYADAAMIALQLRAIPFHEAMTDGRPVPVREIRRGDALFYDMRRDPRARVMTRSHSLHFVLSRRLMDEAAEAVGSSPVEGLRPPTGVVVQDHQLMRFGVRTLAVLREPRAASALFIGHLALALGIYACGRYGGMKVPAPRRSTLSAAQSRLAGELIAASLAGDMELAELASACGMAVRPFVIAFRETMGMAPYQWLQMRRMDAARSLIAGGSHSMTDIALSCGLGDEAHLRHLLTGTRAAEVGYEDGLQ
jgi:AraC-like DNA-binding protein